MLPDRVSDLAALTGAQVGAQPADDQAGSRAPEPAAAARPAWPRPRPRRYVPPLYQEHEQGAQLCVWLEG